MARCTCFQTHAALRHSTADCSRLKCRRSHLLIRHSISLVASRSGNGSTNTPLRSFFTLPPVAVGGLSIVMTVSVCLSAGISPELYQFFFACYLCPWFGPPLAALRYVVYFRFMDDVIFAHNEHMRACRCNITETASRPDGAARRLGRGPWLVATSRKPVGPYDVGCCKLGAKSAVCDCLVVFVVVDCGSADFIGFNTTITISSRTDVTS